MIRRGSATLILLPLLAAGETYRFQAEWRGVDAGQATLETSPSGNSLTLVTQGFARVLYPVNDNYQVAFDPKGCVSSSRMTIEEGSKRAETNVTYGASIQVLLRNLKTGKDETRGFPGEACTYDLLGALAKFRGMRPEKGKPAEFAIANDRKFARVKVEELGRETLQTKSGPVAAIRHEVHALNGILYGRKGRLFLWLSDDAARTPLRIRVQMPFYLGTVTLELENRL